jgi:high-affinity iron transporter
MFAASLVTLRETLETTLVVSIVLLALQQLNARRYNIVVWLGVLAGALLSLAFAFLLDAFAAKFEGPLEQAYEAITMVLAGGLLTWMIVWMFQRRREVKGEITRKVQEHMSNGYLAGIFFLVLTSTMREGIETVIFLKALIIQSSGGYELFGGFAGIAVAIFLSILLFRGIAGIPMRKIFTVSSVLLMLFAAGLLAHAVHEIQELGYLSLWSTELWNINPPLLVDGSYPLLHEKGLIGSMFAALLGYNGNPSGLELATYVSYLALMALLWRKMAKAKPRLA